MHRVAALSLTQLGFNPTSYSLSGVLIAQLAIGVLSILVITSEHATGMIRATFAAVPQRGVVLAAKATVLSIIVLITGEAASFIAFGVGQAILSTHHEAAGLNDPGVLRAVVGAGLYLTLLGLMALSIGVLVRHSAGAIAVLFGLLFVLPAVTDGLPPSLQINPYLPSYAGQAIFHTTEDIHVLPPWQGFALFCLYTALALAAATISIRRRDV